MRKTPWLMTFVVLAAVSGWAQNPELVSVNALGNNGGNFISGRVTSDRSPGVSDDGRMVVFESRATDLVALTDNNGDTTDIFVRDMVDNQTEMVNIRLAGDGGSSSGASDPAISGNGRYVAFRSVATDLVSQDTSGGISNIFLRDLVTGTTFLVSVREDGTAGGNDNSCCHIVSRDGRFVFFGSEADNLTDIPDSNGRNDLFVWDRLSGEVELVTVNASGTSSGSGYPGTFYPSISDPLGNNIYVVFASTFSDLVSSDNNGVSDVFYRRVPGGPTYSASGILGNGESYGPNISATGGWITFTSNADNLVANDTNGTYDCFLYDFAGIILVSKNQAGTASGNASSGCLGVNANRGFVLFGSNADDLVTTDTNADQDIFIRQVRAGVTSLVTANSSNTDSSNGYSFARSELPAISANGRFVVFESFATDLENTNSDSEVDVYVRDHCLGTTHLMNPNLAGTNSSNFESDHAHLSRDGRWVVFSSRATDLDTLDSNGFIDAYRAEVPGWGGWECGQLDLFRDGFESGTTSSWSNG